MSWTLTKKLDGFAGPGEIKRREVVLDPQVSPEEIKSREVELGCESWSFLLQLIVSQRRSYGHCLRDSVGTAIAWYTSCGAMPRGALP